MRWKRYAMIAGWGAVLGVFIGGTLFSVVHSVARKSDFAIYLAAANALRHNPHAAIYSMATLASTHVAYGGCPPPQGWGYLYQPLLALALEPLTLVSCGAATAIWLALNIGIMLACVTWLVRRMKRRHGASAALTTAALCALSIPLYYGLYYGQVHLLILSSCLAAVSLMRRGHPRWAGAALAVGAFLKYLPALLLVYYLARRQWAAGIGAAIATAILALLELAIVGPGVLSVSLIGSSDNLLATMPASMTVTLPYEPYIVTALALGIFAVVCLALARWGRADDPSALGMSVGEAWAIGAMVFVSPVLWYHYLTWLLPTTVVLLSAAFTFQRRCLRWLSFGALAVLSTLTFDNVSTLVPTLMALILWLTCTGVLLTQIGVPLPMTRRIPERATAQVSGR